MILNIKMLVLRLLTNIYHERGFPDPHRRIREILNYVYGKLQTENGRNDHVTMFILNLPLAVFSFLVKLSSFVQGIKGLNYFALFPSAQQFFKKISKGANSNNAKPV